MDTSPLSLYFIYQSIACTNIETYDHNHAFGRNLLTFHMYDIHGCCVLRYEWGWWGVGSCILEPLMWTPLNIISRTLNLVPTQ